MRLFLPAALAALGPLAALTAPPTKAPTYTQHVAPLLRARCVGCHRADGAAPFRLDSFGQAKRWSAMSLRVADARRMPPWKPGEEGVFHDENRLTKDEIETLRAWDKAGSPEGPAVIEPASASEPVPSAPDRVLQASKPYVVMAGSEDEYRYFVVANPYKETRWLRGIELKPGNPHVVHHITAFLDASGDAARSEAKNDDGQPGYGAKHGGRFRPSAILGFWAPGMANRPFPEGTAMELPPGASIVVQVHYVSTGKAEGDRWSLGLRLADAPPAKPISTVVLERQDLAIPAGAAHCRIVEEQPLPSAVAVWGVMPHAHALARRLSAEAILPDGAHRLLVSIDDWDPAWQSMYRFKEAVHLPKGARLRFTAEYDNSDANPRNPYSPPRASRGGEGSRDEMMLLGLLVTRE